MKTDLCASVSPYTVFQFHACEGPAPPGGKLCGPVRPSAARRYVDAGVQSGSACIRQVAPVVDGGKVTRSALVTAEVPCTFMVTPLRRDVLWTAGAEQVAVTTAPGCAWTAASESGFLAVTSGTMGTGPATVSYTVPPRRLLPTAPPAAPGRDR